MLEHQRRTQAAYDGDALGWKERGSARQLDLARSLRRESDGLIADLGCGPGWHLPILEPAVGVDLSFEATKLALEYGQPIHGDLTQLPFARESIAGVWASRSLVHVPRTEMPMALAELHRVMKTGAHGYIWLFEGDNERVVWPDDPLPGRTFSHWPPDLLRRTFEGAGFELSEFTTWPNEHSLGQLMSPITRLWSLPDYVGANMKLLVCGLNPSPGSADHGVGFHRAGNRFWPAAIQAGLVNRDRDPRHALLEHGVGMTDMVKRPTRRADELDTSEYQAGLQRVTQLVEWLQPEAICMVGLAGWRAAVDRKAQRGWQPNGIAGRPVYLMSSTSGLNAHDTVDSLADHMRSAMSPTSQRSS